MILALSGLSLGVWLGEQRRSVRYVLVRVSGRVLRRGVFQIAAARGIAWHVYTNLAPRSKCLFRPRSIKTLVVRPRFRKSIKSGKRLGVSGSPESCSPREQFLVSNGPKVSVRYCQRAVALRGLQEHEHDSLRNRSVQAKSHRISLVACAGVLPKNREISGCAVKERICREARRNSPALAPLTDLSVSDPLGVLQNPANST